MPTHSTLDVRCGRVQVYSPYAPPTVAAAENALAMQSYCGLKTVQQWAGTLQGAGNLQDAVTYATSGLAMLYKQGACAPGV